MAFRSAIDGLDKVIRSEVVPPKVILVTGPPGSMKTSFCYTLMSRYLKDTGEFGLYTTLEETVQSHLRNMESLVDGIVMLGLDRSRGKLVRYLQVEKMRSVEHSMEKHAIEIRKGGITVMGPIFEAGGNS